NSGNLTQARAFQLVSSQEIEFYDCTFRDLRAAEGPALLISNVDFMVIDHCEFEQNQALHQGGAIFITSLLSIPSELLIRNSTFLNCSAEDSSIISERSNKYTINRGGAISSQAQLLHLRIESSRFESCSTTRYSTLIGPDFIHGNDSDSDF